MEFDSTIFAAWKFHSRNRSRRGSPVFHRTACLYDVSSVSWWMRPWVWCDAPCANVSRIKIWKPSRFPDATPGNQHDWLENAFRFWYVQPERNQYWLFLNTVLNDAKVEKHVEGWDSQRNIFNFVTWFEALQKILLQLRRSKFDQIPCYSSTFFVGPVQKDIVNTYWIKDCNNLHSLKVG